MNETTQPIEVALVEDNVRYLDELSLLLDESPDFRLSGRYTHGKDAIEGINKNRPEVALVDMELPDIPGINVIETLTAQGCPTEFMVLTVYDDDRHLFDALQAGALGYIVKGATTLSDIKKAIHDLINGGAPMSPEIAKRVLETFRNKLPKKKNAQDLTRREVQILEYITAGYSTKKVAEKLHISYETVRTHLKNIYQKLHVHTLVEAMIVFNEEI